MARYLMFWEIDANRMPTDPKERGKAWNGFLHLVRRDLEKGILKDFGATPAEGRGYVIAEGNETEISVLAQQYVPQVRFKTFPVMTVAQTDVMLRALNQ